MLGGLKVCTTKSGGFRGWKVKASQMISTRFITVCIRMCVLCYARIKECNSRGALDDEVEGNLPEGDIDLEEHDGEDSHEDSEGADDDLADPHDGVACSRRTHSINHSSAVAAKVTGLDSCLQHSSCCHVREPPFRIRHLHDATGRPLTIPAHSTNKHTRNKHIHAGISMSRAEITTFESIRFQIQDKQKGHAPVALGLM